MVGPSYPRWACHGFPVLYKASLPLWACTAEQLSMLGLSWWACTLYSEQLSEVQWVCTVQGKASYGGPVPCTAVHGGPVMVDVL